ncbi:hypothetical protein PCASD_01685 [Puccinia coronata f. sp. avenae]|uniref:Uncharacterized protein n=1 Tax=Puccinia coronata f. sp. avenae TaxID=200324 RepID=A0A2N5VJX3_9BASI|nr:hypothetical protein PCASD_01685 [Puccinia coronata f. sp. avenae]
MSANYAIYTSPHHQPIPDHLPTLIITPQGKPHQILYTYLHTNYNQENYLLTPSDQGDLCVAKLFPPNKRTQRSASSSGHHNPDRAATRCEASRNLKWTIRNEGIQNPVYKLTLPNPDNPQVEQPLFQVSKPNPNCPWWTLFYFTYAGHLIPPKRIEFGKIVKAQPNGPKASGETKITVTGKTEEEKAVWRTLGEGNEDMVEWILVCAAMSVLDEEISKAAEAAGVPLTARPSTHRPQQHSPQSQPATHATPQQQHAVPVSKAQDRQLHPTGNAHRPPVAAPIRPAVYHTPHNNNNSSSSKGPSPPSSHHRHPPPPHQQQQQQQQQPSQARSGSSHSSHRSHPPSAHNPAHYSAPNPHHPHPQQHPLQQQQQQHPSSRAAHPSSSMRVGPSSSSGHTGKPDPLYASGELAYRSTRQPPPPHQMPPHASFPVRTHQSHSHSHPHHPQHRFAPPHAAAPVPLGPRPAPRLPLPHSPSAHSRAPIQVTNYPIHPHSKQVR